MRSFPSIFAAALLVASAGGSAAAAPLNAADGWSLYGDGSDTIVGTDADETIFADRVGEGRPLPSIPAAEMSSTDAMPSLDRRQMPAFLPDPRYALVVVYVSDPGDVNAPQISQIVLKDLVTGTARTVSVASGGALGTGASFSPAVSPDGRWAAFATKAANIVGAPTAHEQVVVKDLWNLDAPAIVVSRPADVPTGLGNGPSVHPVFSPRHGRLAFQTEASNLMPSGTVADTNGRRDIYMITFGEVPEPSDVATLRPASTKADGGFANGDSTAPAFAPSGAVLAFASEASDLDPSAPSVASGLYVKRLSATSVSAGWTGGASFVSCERTGGNCTAAATATADWPAFSPDGQEIAFVSTDETLVAADGNGSVADALVVTVGGDGPRAQGTLRLVSRHSNGTQAIGPVSGPLVWTPDGVGLLYSVDSIVIGPDVFPPRQAVVKWDVFDGEAGEIALLSRRANSAEAGGDDDSGLPVVSPDGMSALFVSRATNIGSGATMATRLSVFPSAAGGADDVSGGGGDDRIVGGFGSDRIVGGSGSDLQFGGPGDDSFVFGGGDLIDGGSGVDVLVLFGPRSRYEILVSTSHAPDFTVRDLLDPQRTTTVRNVEKVQVSVNGIATDKIDLLPGIASTNNTPPVAATKLDFTVLPGGTVDLPVAVDGSGDALTYTIQKEPIIGRAVVKPSGVVAYSVGAVAAGSDTLTVVARDPYGAESAPILVTLVIPNVPPKPATVSVRTRTGQATAPFHAAVDPNDSAVAYTVTTAPKAGTVTKAADGRLVYTSSASKPTATADSFVVKASSNGQEISVPVKVAIGITVVGHNGPNRLKGGAGDDALHGRGGADRLVGGSGRDTLKGGTGNDLLYGGADKDTLDGGAGADRMEGGAGDDTYVVDAKTDTVVEAANGGTDRIVSAISLTLPANVERLTLSGTAPLVGAGNDLANLLVGNKGANTLSGGKGADVLIGGLGADRLFGGPGADTANYASAKAGVAVSLKAGTGTAGEAKGDTFSSVENLVGSKYADVLVGSDAQNTIDGGAGDDRIEIIEGKYPDIFRGGPGNDTFVVKDLAACKIYAPFIIDLSNDDVFDFSSADGNPSMSGFQAFSESQFGIVDVTQPNVGDIRALNVYNPVKMGILCTIAFPKNINPTIKY